MTDKNRFDAIAQAAVNDGVARKFARAFDASNNMAEVHAIARYQAHRDKGWMLTVLGGRFFADVTAESFQKVRDEAQHYLARMDP